MDHKSRCKVIFDTFKSINVCGEVNKLTLFIICFEKCSVAKKNNLETANFSTCIYLSNLHINMVCSAHLF